jgi:hypothetical protein
MMLPTAIDIECAVLPQTCAASSVISSLVAVREAMMGECREETASGKRPFLRETASQSGVSSLPVSAVILVSFDIDGTLEVGHPPGVVPISLVRRARQRGYLVGSCSDRPLSYQRAMWERLEIPADFTALKHRLDEVKARFAATAYYHVGDTEVDRFFAEGAGFRFLRADPDAHRAWSVELLGSG